MKALQTECMARRTSRCKQVGGASTPRSMQTVQTLQLTALLPAVTQCTFCAPIVLGGDTACKWCGLQVVKALAGLNTADSSAVGAFLKEAAAAAQPPDQAANPLHPSSSNQAHTAASGDGGGGGGGGGNSGGGSGGSGKVVDHTSSGGTAADPSDDWRALSVQ